MANHCLLFVYNEAIIVLRRGWNIVLDKQTWALRRRSPIATVEAEQIGAHIIVIVGRKAQTELCTTCQIDIREGRIEEYTAIGRSNCGNKFRHRLKVTGRFIRCELKIGALQCTCRTKEPRFNLCPELTVRGKRVRSCHARFDNAQVDRVNFRTIGQAARGEIDHAAILAVACVIAHGDSIGRAVQAATDTTGFSRFEQPAILRVRRRKFDQNIIKDNAIVSAGGSQVAHARMCNAGNLVGRDVDRDRSLGKHALDGYIVGGTVHGAGLADSGGERTRGGCTAKINICTRKTADRFREDSRKVDRLAG